MPQAREPSQPLSQSVEEQNMQESPAPKPGKDPRSVVLDGPPRSPPAAPEAAGSRRDYEP